MTGLGDAMAFLRAAREDEALAARLRALRGGTDLAPVVEIAREAGFVLDAAQLREAYRQDYGLRRAGYAAIAASAESTVADVNSASSST